MPAIHRDKDSRVCGASTVAVGQNTVYANNLLVSVSGDPNTHGGGNLIGRCKEVYAGYIMVVNHSPDDAAPDALCPGDGHCDPMTASGSPDVFVGD